MTDRRGEREGAGWSPVLKDCGGGFSSPELTQVENPPDSRVLVEDIEIVTESALDWQCTPLRTLARSSVLGLGFSICGDKHGGWSGAQ